MHNSGGWQWDRNVGILTNPLVLASLFKGFAAAFGVLWLVLEIVSWTMKKSMTLYVFTHPLVVLKEGIFVWGFIAVIIVVTAMVTAIIFRNGYDARFGVNEQGAWMTPQPGQRQTNERIHNLLFGLGLLMRKPGAVGMAILADATQERSVAWSEVKKVESYPSRLAIGFHDSWHCALIIYCLPENYEINLNYAWPRVHGQKLE